MPATSPALTSSSSVFQPLSSHQRRIHAQQHFGPVLRLGAAGAGLHVDEGVVRIHLAGEHALEFELLDMLRQPFDVGGNRLGRAVVLFGLGQFEQFVGAVQALVERADAVDDLVERSALLAELLCAFRVVPDVRIFQFATDFLETFALGVVVKDTP